MIHKNQVMKRFEALKVRREQGIDQRRARLAAQLAREEAALLTELKSSVETSEARRSKLAQKARDLAAQKEKERRALADEKMLLQWKRACDPLRAAESHRVAERVAEQRKAQIVEKAVNEEKEREIIRGYDAAWDQRRILLERKHEAEVAERKARDAEATQILNDQVSIIQQLRVQAEERRQEDIREMKAQWQLEEDEAEAERIRRFHAHQALGVELREFNDQKLAMMAEEKAREEAIDAKMVADQMQAAREAEERELAQKEKQKEESAMYREHLRMLMQKEMVDDSEKDRLIEEAAQAQQAKRDAQWAKEAEARAKLMAQVKASREEQIAQRQRNKVAAKANEKAELHRLNEEMANMEAVKNAQQEALRAERLQNRLDIQGQIRYNEARARFQEDEKIREGIFARQMESDYQAQIKKVFETSEPKTYYPRSHTKWFT